MNLFDIDLDAAGALFARQGWLHLPGAVTPTFLEHARQVIAAELAGSPDTVGGNAANKEQFRFDFDDLWSAQAEIFAVFAAVTGRSPADLTLSERHVNAYRPDADPDPVPHKDRRASQVTVGLSIDVPPGSHLVLWPSCERDENPYESAAELYSALGPERRPEQALRGAPAIIVHDHPGDVVVFAGSTTWHCRRRAAGTTNLFFKMNDFGDDPLLEDARHAPAVSAR